MPENVTNHHDVTLSKSDCSLVTQRYLQASHYLLLIFDQIFMILTQKEHMSSQDSISNKKETLGSVLKSLFALTSQKRSPAQLSASRFFLGVVF